MAGRIILGVFNPALNANGVVDAGLTLTFYKNGTTTPQAIYTDATLSTALSNPLSCIDASGRFPQIWAPSRNTYSVKVTPTGASPITYNDIAPFGSISDGQVINLADFDGYDPTGATDQTATFNAAIQEAYADGLNLFMPPGTYLSTTGGIVPKDGVEIVGASRSSVLLKLGDSATDAFFSSSGVSGEFVFRSFSMRGTWDITHNDTGQRLVFVRGALTTPLTGRIWFDDIEASYSRSMSLTGERLYEAKATNCYVHDSSRDAVNFENCNVRVYEDILVKACGDNGIAGSVSNGGMPLPIQSLVFVDNVRLFDTFGANFLGCTGGLIDNFYASRSKGTALAIGNSAPSFSEGLSSGHHIVVGKNVILEDTINALAFSAQNICAYIVIGGYAQKGSANAIPYRPYDGAIIPPEPYIGNYATGSTITVPPGAGWDINGICRRTLPAVTNYSDWGLGEMFTTAGYVDPAITDDLMAATGVRISGYIKDGRIDVIAEPGGVGILLDLDGADDFTLDGLTISGRFTRCLSGGIATNAGSAVKVNVAVRDADFDCDPRFESAVRGTSTGKFTGAWTFGSEGPSGLELGYVQGVTYERCTFKNCQIPVHGNGSSLLENLGGNRVICDPTSGGTGQNTANVGVGNIPICDGSDFSLVVQGGDPRTGAAIVYGNTVFVQTRSGTAVPTTGWWLKGAFFRNASGTVGQPTGWTCTTEGPAGTFAFTAHANL